LDALRDGDELHGVLRCERSLRNQPHLLSGAQQHQQRKYVTRGLHVWRTERA